ncbi:MAG: ribonuclease J [Bdellovibrionales bacterium]
MSPRKKDIHRPPDDAVWFLSLGGAGEIGMNLNLYGTAGKWLMVDCGITFGDETTPGVEIIVPDAGFIAERREDLVGMVITHGHEDHIGAIEHLWPQLKCPIYATRFTAELIRAKTRDPDMASRVRIIELPLGGDFEIGPFKGEMIRVTHSIPEAHMLALTTKHGTVLHTGDWKFDPEPVIGHLTDEARLKELGRNKLMAVIGDSTNATVPGHSGSELDARRGLDGVFGSIRKRIVVCCFSSNVARLKSITAAAHAHGRYVTLAGRSLWRNAEIAEACGYLPEFSNYLSENEAMLSPRDKVVIIATGCQGEPRSALWRIAMEDHPEIELDAGDTVIFSSRDIPGNEKQIARLQNQLIARGLTVITQNDAPVHVSGHPAQEELAELYQWTRPNLVLPVHGEPRHQAEHARIAKECQVPHVLIPRDGQIIRLGPGVHEIVAEVPCGRLGLDGKRLRPLDREATKDRRKMGFNGAMVITLVMDGRGLVVQDPQIALLGLADGAGDPTMAEDISAAILDGIEAMPKSTRLDDAAVRHRAAQSARRFMQDMHGKKPVMEVHVVRV